MKAVGSLLRACYSQWAHGTVVLVMLTCCDSVASAAPPAVLYTPGYQSTVRADPGDLLLIAGERFNATDRVVYEAAETRGAPGGHPRDVPVGATETVGTAPVVKIGLPPISLTVRLPVAMQKRAYRLWVVNAANEWSRALMINDLRPLWLTPSYSYSSADPAGLGRRLRIVGRNLEPTQGRSLQIRLEGPKSYGVTAEESAGPQPFVCEITLPANMPPGAYAVSVSRDGTHWRGLNDQRFEVRPDPPKRPSFNIDDPRFGNCQADDDADDSPCVALAIAAAREAGGAVIVFPPGTWDIRGGRTFELPRNVDLAGSPNLASVIARHDATAAAGLGALFALTGNNTVAGLHFEEAQRIGSIEQARAMIQLGAVHGAPDPHDTLTDVIISGNVFRPVGRAIVDSGQPISHLFVTHNEFGAFATALNMPGNLFNVTIPYRIDDAVVRENRFLPGSYTDVTARQGTIASQLGASYRVDFSANSADGSSTAALQEASDPKGWRAAFFWNMNNNHEYLLVSGNHILCPGDKVGDGEAIAFDGSGDTFAFNGAQEVSDATSSTLVVRGILLATQNDRRIERASYYVGHWVQVVAGVGLGQARKIASYTEDAAAGTVTFRVSPQWDVVPAARGSRVVVGREFWQVYAVDNDVDQRSTVCTKGNLTRPNGGVIEMWAPSADSAIDLNTQFDTSGIAFQQQYNAAFKSCAACNNSASIQLSLEVRDNDIDGEYDWSSDCSLSGITGSFAAGATPESPPPTLSFGTVIAHNSISHADGLRGGAIDIVSTWTRGPPPGGWPLVRNLLVFGNTLRDIGGSRPRSNCRYGGDRVGIRLDGVNDILDTVLSDNQCDRVDSVLADRGIRTTRVDSSSATGARACHSVADSTR